MPLAFSDTPSLILQFVYSQLRPPPMTFGLFALLQLRVQGAPMYPHSSSCQAAVTSSLQWCPGSVSLKPPRIALWLSSQGPLKRRDEFSRAQYGCFYKLRVLFVGVLILQEPYDFHHSHGWTQHGKVNDFGIYIRAPDFWKLPCG